MLSVVKKKYTISLFNFSKQCGFRNYIKTINIYIYIYIKNVIEICRCKKYRKEIKR